MGSVPPAVLTPSPRRRAEQQRQNPAGPVCQGFPADTDNLRSQLFPLKNWKLLFGTYKDPTPSPQSPSPLLSLLSAAHLHLLPGVLGQCPDQSPPLSLVPSSVVDAPRPPPRLHPVKASYPPGYSLGSNCLRGLRALGPRPFHSNPAPSLPPAPPPLCGTRLLASPHFPASDTARHAPVFPLPWTPGPHTPGCLPHLCPVLVPGRPVYVHPRMSEPPLPPQPSPRSHTVYTLTDLSCSFSASPLRKGVPPREGISGVH